MLRRWLQGSPFKHPAHPALVHYPIGLFTVSLLFDLGNLLFGPEGWLSLAAFYSMAGGILMALLAAVPGLIDWTEIRADHPGKRTATLHLLLNLAVIGLFVANFLLRIENYEQPGVSGLPLTLSIAAVGAVFVSGYLGGLLIYDQGISVGRYRRQTGLPDRTMPISSPPDPTGFVQVAEAADLDDGETLRISVNGEVMAIVNLQGEYYAYNEFCTHRFGPLSEGAFHENQVECPWHRSCFDVRTGKVTRGPAKVDVKTYEVSVRDGSIYVRIPMDHRV